MRHDIELAYIGIEVADPTSLDPFFGEVIGLTAGDSTTPGGRTWRNDSRVHRIIVEPGPANDATYLGIEAADVTAFEALLERVDRAGCELQQVSDTDVASRRVQRLARVATPWGMSLEVVLGLGHDPTPFSSSLVSGGFLTDRVGFGHAVFATTAFDESHAFLTDVIGMGQSDWLHMEIAEGIELEVHFYHCNERHHSIALARAPFELPQRLHHVMFEVVDRDDVGLAFDRAWQSGLPIPSGLGRHPNDQMFSFYVASPAGFQVEVGHGGRPVTDDWDDNRRYDRISAWGHQPVTRG